MNKPRHLASILRDRFGLSRSLYIFGPRQSGKTTLANLTFPDLPHRSLEDPDILEHAQTDPRSFLSQFTSGGIIDEPQRFPKLFSYLQSEIDIHKRKFILTSSQNFLMMDQITQSLAGRIAILNLWPLSQQEIREDPYSSILTMTHSTKEFRPITQLWPSILLGGYPEIVTTPSLAEFWFGDYIKTYLERDVRQILSVQDVGTFQRFVKLCAGRSGSILNRASLASDSGISETTCSRWLSVLEQSGIIYLVQPYHQNFNKRLTKSPKLYFVDTGLLCHLLGIRTPTQLDTHPSIGHIVETFVVSELFKHVLNSGQTPSLFFWRDHNGHEIDIIWESNQGIIPIEIKAGRTIASDWNKPLQKWQDLSPSNPGIVLYGGDQFQTRNGIRYIPISAL